MPRTILDTQSALRARRRVGAAERVFTSLNIAVFLVLAGCVVVAVVLWERWV
jgi:hypothetical protein